MCVSAFFLAVRGSAVQKGIMNESESTLRFGDLAHNIA